MMDFASRYTDPGIVYNASNVVLIIMGGLLTRVVVPNSSTHRLLEDIPFLVLLVGEIVTTY